VLEERNLFHPLLNFSDSHPLSLAHLKYNKEKEVVKALNQALTNLQEKAKLKPNR